MELAANPVASLRSARMKLPPYPMIEPNLGAPLDVHRATVLPEWIDWNGHMNVGFYVVAFDKATDTLCQQFGCGWEYTRDKLGMANYATLD